MSKPQVSSRISRLERCTRCAECQAWLATPVGESLKARPEGRECISVFVRQALFQQHSPHAGPQYRFQLDKLPNLGQNAMSRTEFPLSHSRERLTESKATTLDNKRRKLCRTAFKFGWDAMAPDTSSNVRYLPSAPILDTTSLTGIYP